MVEKATRFVTVLLDGDVAGNQKFMTQFRVRGYPTVLFVDPTKESEIARLGKRDPDSVLAQMDEALATEIAKPDKPGKKKKKKGKEPAKAKEEEEMSRKDNGSDWAE